MADRTLELALKIKALVEGAQSIEDLSAKLEEFGRDAKAAEAPAGALGQDLKAVATAAQQADTALEGVAGATQQTGKAAKVATDPMAQLRARMQEIRDQRNPMDEFNRGLTQTEKAARPVPGMLEQIKGMAAQLAATFLIAKTALDLNDRFTALQRGFTAVTGSAEATQESLNFVRDVADRLGVGVLDLGQNFLKLSAAAKGTQLEGAATEQIFSSLTSALSTVGASTGDAENALNAVAQMMSKGVISAEELRGQLGDVLPGAAQQAAAALGVSNAEFNKMLESGEVLAKDFLPKFAAQLDKAFSGGKTQVESFSASWNRLLNQLSDLATGEVGTGLTKFISATTDGLRLLARGAGFVSDAVGAAGKALGGFAAGEATAATQDFGQALVDASVKLFGFKTEAEAAAERKKQMAAELRNLIPEVDRFQAAVDRKELKELPESLQAALAEFRKTGDAAAAATIAVKEFMTAPAENLTLEGILKLATSLKAVGREAQGAAILISTTLGAQLSKLTTEQLAKLEAQTRKAMAAASDGSAASRAAFAELGQVLESLVLARLQRLGVDGPEALTGLSLAAQAAIADFTALATTGNLTGEAIKKAFEGALAQLDNAGELEAFRQKIIALGQDGTLTGAQVERALWLIGQRQRELANDPALDALRAQYDRLRATAEQGVTAHEQLLIAQRNEAQARLKLAEAMGDEQEARARVIDLTRLESDLAQINAAKKGIKLQAAVDLLRVIQQEIESKLALNEIVNEESMARLKAAQTAMEAAAVEVEAAGLVAEAETKKAAAIALGALNAGKATDKTREHTEATQAQTGVVEQASLKLNANAEASEGAAESGGSLAAVIASQIDYWRNATGALSAATQALFDWYAGLSKIEPQYGRQVFGSISDEADQAGSKIGELTAYIREMDKAMLFSTGSVGHFMARVNKAGATAQRAYYEQKLEAEKLEAQLAQIGETGGRSFANIDAALGFVQLTSEQTRNSLWLLNDQDMDDLKTALDGAADKLREMQRETDNARDRLAELNAELLEAKGEDQKAEILRQELDYQTRMAEIEQRRRQAELTGNRELVAILDQQRQTLEEINRAKLDSIKNTETDADAARRSVDSAGTVKDAWAGAADEIERAHQAVSSVGAADLSRLSSQLTRLGTAARGLAGAL